MSEERISPDIEEDLDEELGDEEGRRVLEKQQELREQLALLRSGVLHSPGLELLLSDFGKYYILEARADIEPFLASEESEERRYALMTLAVDFRLQEHLESARRFLTSDPDSFCRITATTALACLMENTDDRPTLQLLAHVVCNEQENNIIRKSAYGAMLAILGAPKREVFLTATSRFHFPEDVKWKMVDEYREK